MEIKLKVLVLFFILIFLSCKNVTNQKNSKKTYYYKISDDYGNVKGYFERRIEKYDTIRIDSIFRLSKSKQYLDTIIEKYITSIKGLKNFETKSFFLKNDISIDSCYPYKEFYMDSIEVCYIGRIDLVIGLKKYTNVTKFNVREYGPDGVSRYLYFDNQFILLKDEFISGYSRYFNIEIIGN